MPVRVKVCGITRVSDAVAAAHAGASAIGLVFWPGSPRCVTVERAREIAIAAAAERLTVVGVFVDQPPHLLQSIARSARLDAIQLHGHESIGAYEFGMPIIKAFGIAAGWNAGALSGLPASVLPLLDARDDLRKGGTGVAIDWELAALASSVRPIVLAGGLTPENVPIAIRTASPFAVDVSSGVETRPGVKDGRRMRAFIDAVRDSGGPVPRGLFA